MKFSIVVPSFNQDLYLAAALDSILAQPLGGIEILVNDGGSTDRSREVLQGFDGRVQWTSQADHGQTDAINKGLHQANGDIVAYLNSDDVYQPEALRIVSDYFAAHPTCDLLYGAALHLRADGSTLEPYPTQNWDYAALFETCFICQPAVFWRRRVHETHGFFDERLHFAMDYEFWLRVGQTAEIHYLPETPLAGSRLHDDTKTLRKRIPAHREILEVIRQYAQSPRQCYTWLRHLASLRASQNGAAPSILEDRQRKHELAFARELLALAEEFEIELDETMLIEIERATKRGKGA